MHLHQVGRLDLAGRGLLGELGKHGKRFGPGEGGGRAVEDGRCVTESRLRAGRVRRSSADKSVILIARSTAHQRAVHTPTASDTDGRMQTNMYATGNKLN